MGDNLSKNKNLYSVLGVGINASPEEIKKSYRALAQKYHPDKNNGDKKAEEIFKEVNEAYSILSNQEKRTEYDEQCDIKRGSTGTTEFQKPDINFVYTPRTFGKSFVSTRSTIPDFKFIKPKKKEGWEPQMDGTDEKLEKIIENKEKKIWNQPWYQAYNHK